MATLLYTHPSFEKHDTGLGHPECAERIRAILTSLESPQFSSLIRKTARRATENEIRLIHPQQYIDRIVAAIPKNGHQYIDGDTVVSPASAEAAFNAAGAVCDAIDRICHGEADNGFCVVRPPGHHAEPNRAMGFCLFNNIAIGAEYAKKNHGIGKVAIIDFDVHHGNGTQAAFYHDPNVLYASTHESPLYPGTGQPNETGVGNIFNAPLSSGSARGEFQKAMEERIFPALSRFKPEMLLISAGFDAHRNDPLASLNLVEDDYAWITLKLMEFADQYCEGKCVSVLEGGYNLQALGDSAAAHIHQLLS